MSGSDEKTSHPVLDFINTIGIKATLQVPAGDIGEVASISNKYPLLVQVQVAFAQ